MNNLSGLQKAIVGIGLGLVIATVLFPPWQVSMFANTTTRPGGYSFIGSPPQHAREIDSARVMLQLAGVAIVCYVAVSLAAKPQRDEE